MKPTPATTTSSQISHKSTSMPASITTNTFDNTGSTTNVFTVSPGFIVAIVALSVGFLIALGCAVYMVNRILVEDAEERRRLEMEEANNDDDVWSDISTLPAYSPERRQCEEESTRTTSSVDGAGDDEDVGVIINMDHLATTIKKMKHHGTDQGSVVEDDNHHQLDVARYSECSSNSTSARNSTSALLGSFHHYDHHEHIPNGHHSNRHERTSEELNRSNSSGSGDCGIDIVTIRGSNETEKSHSSYEKSPVPSTLPPTYDFDCE